MILKIIQGAIKAHQNKNQGAIKAHHNKNQGAIKAHHHNKNQGAIKAHHNKHQGTIKVHQTREMTFPTIQVTVMVTQTRGMITITTHTHQVTS